MEEIVGEEGERDLEGGEVDEGWENRCEVVAACLVSFDRVLGLPIDE